MKFRLVLVFIASLAAASLANAACLTCIGDGTSGDGFCQPSSNGRCSYTCCLWDAGTPCSVWERTFGCSEDSPLLIPSAYFGTPLPMQMQGSSLRLRLGKGKPVQRQCAASILLKKG